MLLTAAAGLALTASAALAADLYSPPASPAVPAPPAVVPPPVPIWSGFYVGINAGLGADRFELPWSAGRFAGTSPLNIDRGIGGIQAGYNWQIGPRWVVALEADFDGSDIMKVRDYTTFTPIGAPTFNVGMNLDWFGTVRPRLGFAVTPSAILYLTGGFAYGHTSSNVISPAGLSSSSNDKTGWASGGGLEYALTDSLSFKTEYVYLDLGTDSFPSGTGLTISGKMIAHTLKAGLNLKLSP